MHKVLALILMFFTLNAVGCIAKTHHSLSLNIDIDQSALARGQVVLVSKLSNNGDVPISFLPWNTPLDSSVNGHFLKVVKHSITSSVELSYVGRMVKRATPKPSDFIQLKPGENNLNRINITNSYNFCRNFDYSIDFIGSLNSTEHTLMTVELNTAEFKASEAFPVCN